MFPAAKNARAALLALAVFVSACGSQNSSDGEAIDWSLFSTQSEDVPVPRNRSVLVIAPHPDDEALLAAGVIRSAVLAGDTVHVAIVTNGDVPGPEFGLRRLRESVSAMGKLGVPEDHVIFLGYGDQTLKLLFRNIRDGQPKRVIVSRAGRNRTYADVGMGAVDFHTLVTGQAADYSGRNVVFDLVQLMKRTEATEIYTSSVYDQHPDHRALSFFLMRALGRMKKQGLALPKVFEGNVHFHHKESGLNWSHDVFEPSATWELPSDLAALQAERGQLVRVPVPTEMLDPVQGSNLKLNVLKTYISQYCPFLLGFVKKDEVFWELGVGRSTR
jgi:LmbE family N-acetylglucosaminyl deacetylase